MKEENKTKLWKDFANLFNLCIDDQTFSNLDLKTFFYYLLSKLLICYEY